MSVYHHTIVGGIHADDEARDTQTYSSSSGERVLMDLNRSIGERRDGKPKYLIQMSPDQAEDLAYALLAAVADARRLSGPVF
jgi:hypothetical protein